MVRLPWPTLAFGLVFSAPEARHDHHAPRARGVAGLDVPIAVSDGVASVEIEIKIPGRPLGQTGLRFAAIAIEAIGRRAMIGVMRAIIDRVNPRPLQPQRLFHPL